MAVGSDADAGGLSGPVAAAVLVNVPAASPDGTLTINVITGADPTARPPTSVQVTMAPLSAQVHPVPAAETKPSPAGSVSDTVIGPGAGESDGPISVTVN